MTRTILSDLRTPERRDDLLAAYATLHPAVTAATVSCVDAGAHVVTLANGHGHPNVYVSPTAAEADGTAPATAPERALALWHETMGDGTVRVRVEYAPDSYTDVRVMRMTATHAAAFVAGVLCGWGLTDF